MPEDIFRNAAWIWDQLHEEKTDHFVLFRKQFSLSGKRLRNDILHISADSKYRLYINGHRVGTGPARGEPGRPYVDSYKVGKFLNSDSENIIAVQVEFYGEKSLIFAPCRGGLILEIPGVVSSGDAGWKCWRLHHSRALSPSWQHLHCVDWNHIPDNWQNLSLDDCNWPEAVVLQDDKLSDPANLPQRTIPHLSCRELSVQRLISLGDTDPEYDTTVTPAISLQQMVRRQLADASPNGVCDFQEGGWEFISRGALFVELDLGCITLGAPFWELETEQSCLVDIGYSECLADDNRVDPFRQNIYFAEKIITRPGRYVYEIFHARGFRYMLLRFNGKGRIRICRAGAREEIYTPAVRGKFSCSDHTLNRIFSMCQRTVNLCMEDAYTDCPWRERQQWLGDLYVESLTSLYMLGAVDLLKKAILEFGTIRGKDKFLPSVTPGGSGYNLPTFGMLYPGVIRNYYEYTGDLAVVEKCYDAVKDMALFLESVRKDDLIAGRTAFADKVWYFIDWTKSDVYDSDGAIQGFYLKFLEDAAALADLLGDRKTELELLEQANRTRGAVERNFWSNERNAFLKYRHDGSTRPAQTPADLIGQHENFLFVCLNVGTPRQRRLAMQSVQGWSGKYLPDLGGQQSRFLQDQSGSLADKKCIMLGSPYFSYWALSALCKQNLFAEALEYIKICWGFMLDNGSDCCWEMWGGTTSLCHGFSTSPGYFFFTGLLGLQILEAGCRDIAISPTALYWDKLKVELPLPQGMLKFSWRKQKNSIIFKIEVPQGCRLKLRLPGGGRSKWFAAGFASWTEYLSQ